MNRLLSGAFLLVITASMLLYTGDFRRLSAASYDVIEAPDPAAHIPSVEAFIAEEHEIQSQIDSFGNLSYVHKADISVSVDGTYERLFYDEGEKVRAGAIVAELSNVHLMIQSTQAESAVNAGRAGLELALARYEEERNRVESRMLGLKKITLEIEQKHRELDEMERIKQNRHKFLAIGGISESEYRATNLSYLSAKTALEMLITDMEILRTGFRSQDISGRGLQIPADESEYRELLIDLNTRTLKAELDVARMKLESAETGLKSAQALIDELTITAPISGIIAVREPEVGEKASSGDRIYTIFENRNIHVVFPVQESDIIALKLGLHVNASIDSYPEKNFIATVDQISPIVDPQSGNVTVRALIADADIALHPGMFVRVSMKTGELRKAILIPSSALFDQRGDEGSVYTIKSRRAFIKILPLGRQTGENIEVLDNLNAGERIINHPSPILSEGQEVAFDE